MFSHICRIYFLSTNPPIDVYINRISNRLLFKIKDGHKIELHSPATMKLFGNTKKLIRKTKIERKCIES